MENCKKVIFLGAGASKDAGYPLASELIDSLKKKYECSMSSINYKEAWKSFNENLKEIKKIPHFKNCNDVEYLMTIMLLLKKTHEDQPYSASNKDPRNFYDKLKNSVIKKIKKTIFYENAFKGLSECIRSYFSYPIMEDSSYKYLHLYLKENLSAGGIVITTNYDLLAERILSNLDLWFANDGYGFNIEIENTSEFQLKHSDDPEIQEILKKFQKNQENKSNYIEEYQNKKSKVKVLKIHGSINWLIEKNDKRFVLDNIISRCFLPECMHGLKDIKYNSWLYDKVYLISPTFMKNYEHQTLLDIWTKSTDAIQQADEIHFIGYSLPEYDTNIRTLLLPLRTKLKNESFVAKIYILKNDQATKVRWENFLGSNIELIEIDSFKQYCEDKYKNSYS